MLGRVGKIPNIPRERMEHYDGKQIRRMNIGGLKWLLTADIPIRLQFGEKGSHKRSVFRKYDPIDYEEKIRMLASLEAIQDELYFD